MIRDEKPKTPHLAGLPAFDRQAHVDPGPEHLRAATEVLRDRPVEEALRAATERAVGQFGWAERGYVAQAREEGEASRVWDTARWIVANAIAREAA